MLTAFARDAGNPSSFVRLLRVRLAQSKLSRLGYRQSSTVPIRSRALGEVSLRPHTTDITVYDEIVRGHQYDGVLGASGDVRSLIDLGANIGLASRLFLSHYPRATVVAVEPDPGNIDVLRRNLAGFEATVVDACVGGRERRVSLVGDRADGFTMADDPAGELQVVTMPRLLELVSSERVDLVKVDIEGAEQEVFESCAAWIGRVRQLVVECHLPYDAEALRAALVGAGAELASFQAGPEQFGYQIAVARLAG